MERLNNLYTGCGCGNKDKSGFDLFLQNWDDDTLGASEEATLSAPAAPFSNTQGAAAGPVPTGGNEAPGGSAVDKILGDLTIDEGECSLGGDVCSSSRVLYNITEFVTFVDSEARAKIGKAEARAKIGKEDTDGSPEVREKESPEAKAETREARENIEKAAKLLGCDTEACVVTHPTFKDFVLDMSGVEGLQQLQQNITTRFKPGGPRETDQLLSNNDIDSVLRLWAAVDFPQFYNFDFNMMDFDETGGSLARVDVADILKGEVRQNLGGLGVVARKCVTFACVLNTDVSTGHGKHWVAVFGDCRGDAWTVEYFNSAGNPPPPPVVRWMERAAEELRGYRREQGNGEGRAQGGDEGKVKTVALTSLRHQKSQTECGLYVLYYIRRRLEGAPCQFFATNLIPDEAMLKFRKRVFRKK